MICYIFCAFFYCKTYEKNLGQFLKQCSTYIFLSLSKLLHKVFELIISYRVHTAYLLCLSLYFHFQLCRLLTLCNLYCQTHAQRSRTAARRSIKSTDLAAVFVLKLIQHFFNSNFQSFTFKSLNFITFNLLIKCRFLKCFVYLLRISFDLSAVSPLSNCRSFLLSFTSTQK